MKREKPLEMSGLRDKLYWREASDGSWHCFKKNQYNTFTSLCGRFDRERSGGQAIDRPSVWQRCGMCDGKEIDRRGWEESGPERRST